MDGNCVWLLHRDRLKKGSNSSFGVKVQSPGSNIWIFSFFCVFITFYIPNHIWHLKLQQMTYVRNTQCKSIEPHCIHFIVYVFYPVHLIVFTSKLLWAKLDVLFRSILDWRAWNVNTCPFLCNSGQKLDSKPTNIHLQSVATQSSHPLFQPLCKLT